MFSNKNVIITGANKGIGREILLLFAKNNANIIACTRKKDDTFQNEINNISKDNNINITNINFDYSTIDEVKESANYIIKNFEKIDVLINNAGVIDTSLFQMTKLSKIREIFEINFFAQLEFTQIILKKMIKNQSSSIINISSTAAMDPVSGRIAYSASKSSIITFSKILSKELAKFKVRVNVIAPGLTETELMRKSHSDEVVEDVLKNISLGRIGNTRDVANLALFLASDKSDYINGQVIRIDGGM